MIFKCLYIKLNNFYQSSQLATGGWRLATSGWLMAAGKWRFANDDRIFTINDRGLANNDRGLIFQLTKSSSPTIG